MITPTATTSPPDAAAPAPLRARRLERPRPAPAQATPPAPARWSVSDFEPPRPDLRRRPDPNAIDLLLRRADALPTSERELLEAVFARGVTIRTIARATGADDRALRRNIRRLASRLVSDDAARLFRLVRSWPAVPRKIAIACLVRGLTLRAAAGEQGVSLYAARKHVAAARALLAHRE